MKIRTIKIKIQERKGVTKFSYCGNGKKTLAQAEQLQEEGKGITELNTPQKAFLSMLHTLYSSGFMPDLED
jgi:hypothetical protein